MFNRVACALSGGIDSAVAAYLLRRRGLDVVGVFMQNWDFHEEADPGGHCPIEADYADAQRVAGRLDIPLHRVNFVKHFWLDVFAHTVDCYASGSSANPDVLCNKHIKFGRLFDYVLGRLDAQAMATGHYARSSFGAYLEHYRSDEGVCLLRPRDRFKDQTYFLCQVARSALARTMFPLAPFLKDDVRDLARQAGLGWLCDKQESFGICMVGPRRFQTFIDQYINGRPGSLLDVDTGQVIGHHEGIHKYTLGQRVRLGGQKHAYYVVRLDPKAGNIYVCANNFHPSLYCKALVTCAPYWISESPASYPCTLDVKTRHPSRTRPCTVTKEQDGRLRVEMEMAMRSLSPGQYAVLYDGDKCLGGAEVLYSEPLFPQYSEDRWS